jgi:hypothetical protein
LDADYIKKNFKIDNIGANCPSQRIRTLSLFSFGYLFENLECELYTSAIAMKTFIKILQKIAQIDEIIKANEDLDVIINSNIAEYNNKFA